MPFLAATWYESSYGIMVQIAIFIPKPGRCGSVFSREQVIPFAFSSSQNKGIFKLYFWWDEWTLDKNANTQVIWSGKMLILCQTCQLLIQSNCLGRCPFVKGTVTLSLTRRLTEYPVSDCSHMLKENTSKNENVQ